MNHFSKCASRFAASILSALVAISVVLVAEAQWAAQSPGDSSASAAPASAKTTDQRLEDLQQEMAALEQRNQQEMSVLEEQIAALKTERDAAPSLQNASFSQPSQTPAAADKITLAGLLGPTTFSGFIDAYYGYDYNHPVDGINLVTPFTANTNAFALNMVEAIVDKAPSTDSTESRFGYHFAAGYGQAAKAINGSDTTSDRSNFYLKEAYGQYIAPVGKGLTIQVGKFVTPMGAEVIETNANLNYSRGLLFYYSIPYFHFGANAKYAWNSKIAATLYLVNGWNNSSISHQIFQSSAGLTYGTSIAYTPNAKWSVTENYFAGPVQDAYLCELQPTGSNCPTLNDWKQLSDTVVGYVPNAKWSFTVNGDYGFGPHNWVCAGDTTNSCHTVGSQANWWVAAGYAKYTLDPKSYFAARYEYFNDPYDYALGSGDINPANRLHAQEVTGTYGYNVTSGLQVRVEYRYDYFSEPIFQTDGDLDNTTRQQHSAFLGFIYSFNSANAK